MIRTPLLIIFLLLLQPFSLKAQLHEQVLDSLRAALTNTSDDTVRMYTYNSIASYYIERDRDSAILYNEASIEAARKLDLKFALADLLRRKAYLAEKKGNFSHSLKLCNEALAIVQDESKEINAFVPRESEFATNPGKFRKSVLANVFHQLGNTYSAVGNKEKAIQYYKNEIQISDELNSKKWRVTSNMNIGSIYMGQGKMDSAFIYAVRALENSNLTDWKIYQGSILQNIGTIYLTKGQLDSSEHYYRQSLIVNIGQNNMAGEINANIALAQLYQKLSQSDSVKHYANIALKLATKLKTASSIGTAASLLSDAWKMEGNVDSALAYLAISKTLGDSLQKDRIDKVTQFQNLNFEDQMRAEKEAQESVAAKNKIITVSLFIGLVFLSLLAFVYYRNNQHKKKANEVLAKTLTNLKETQSQLIQSEKMASLGELTAGIAHEIQNPLNFVNNFSEVNKELIEEVKNQKSKVKTEELIDLLDDIHQNNEKIHYHGKRADAIVKGMLQHTRTNRGAKESTDINALVDEYLRLAYHGLKAKDRSFNTTIKTEFDQSIGNIMIIPQDIGRVLLNLYNNAFYAVDEKKKQAGNGFEPKVTVSTRLVSASENPPISQSANSPIASSLIVSVRDNGKGIPEQILQKIFQPFFTTKPTGQGTGLGLSLSYDIIKAHGGEIRVESKEGEGSVFTVIL